MLGGLIMLSGAFFMIVAASTFVGEQRSFAFILKPMDVIDDDGEITGSSWGKRMGLLTLGLSLIGIGGYMFYKSHEY